MFEFHNGRFIVGRNSNIEIPSSPPVISVDKFVHGFSSSNFKDEVLNSLECIAILVTDREINNGLLSNLLTNIKNTTPPNDIDLNIFTNNSNHNPVLLDDVKDIFKSIHITNLDIDPDVDVYIKPPNKLDTAPQFGYSSGPNILFMKSMDICNKYNTTLVLETDCKLFPGWFEKCKAYVLSQYFMISGSTYDGNNLIPTTDMAMFFHLNGVAFYKTGSLILQFVFSELSRFIQYQVSENKKYYSSYDICLIDLILTGCDEGNETSRKFWKNIMRYMFKTSLIVNASCDHDKYTNEQSLLDLHINCSILHKKFDLKHQE
jgi:hypothetical protein